MNHALKNRKSNSGKTATASQFRISTGSQVSVDKSSRQANSESPLYIRPSQIPLTDKVHPKLTVNQPGDRYEKEADAVADRIMCMEEHGEATVHGAVPRIQRKCTECEKEEEELQLKKSENSPTNPGLNTVSPSFNSRLRNSRGTGNPLPAPTQLSMNHAFGIPLNQVRIHTDTESIRMNRLLNARAFTNGSDIYFNQGEYNPVSEKGKRLLAHELTHVVQQIKGRTFNDIQRQTTGASPQCPTFVSLTVRSQQPAISECGNRCRMGIGCCTTPRGQCGTTGTGAVIEGRIRVGEGCRGELALMQNLLTTDRSRTLSDGTHECQSSDRALRDGGIPWKGCTVSINSAGNHSITSDDCPNIKLRDNMTSASAIDSFKTYMLWKPAGTNARVSIANVNWGWSATARLQTNSGENCTDRWRISNPSKTDGDGTSSGSRPVTSPTAQGLRWNQCSQD